MKEICEMRGPSPDPAGERDLVAVYRRRDSGALKKTYRRDWSPGTPPCTFRSCESVVRHKHCWQSRGAASGWLLLLWEPSDGSGDPVGPVVVCEGEKAAAAVQRASLTGASYVSGARSAGRADYSPVSGRDVVVWPDADSAGLRAGAASALASLEAGASSVRMVDVSGDGPDGRRLRRRSGGRRRRRRGGDGARARGVGAALASQFGGGRGPR